MQEESGYDSDQTRSAKESESDAASSNSGSPGSSRSSIGKEADVSPPSLKLPEKPPAANTTGELTLEALAAAYSDSEERDLSLESIMTR